jgi:hypothetical protein
MTKIAPFEKISDPDAVLDQIVVYAKEINGVTQLFGRSSDGSIHQITPPSGNRIWSYPKVNGPVSAGIPFLTLSGFETKLGKRYTFFASGSWSGNSGTPGAEIDLRLAVIQDSGKSAIIVVQEEALVPSELDSDAACNLSGQGSLIGDGFTHDYTMYVTWNEPAAWYSVSGGHAQSWLTIVESDDQQTP